MNEKLVRKLIQLNDLIGGSYNVNDASRILPMLADVFEQSKEAQAAQIIPSLGATATLLNKYLNNKRDQIVFGLRTHIQILRVLVEQAGLTTATTFKDNHDILIFKLLDNGKQIYDGLPDRNLRLEEIKRKINFYKSQASPAAAAGPLPPPPAPVANTWTVKPTPQQLPPPPSSSGAQPQLTPPPEPYPVGSFTIAIPK